MHGLIYYLVFFKTKFGRLTLRTIEKIFITAAYSAALTRSIAHLLELTTDLSAAGREVAQDIRRTRWSRA